MTRFLVDESLPRSVCRELLARGHEVVDARDAGLRGRPDEEVHRYAVSGQRVLLAADVDFANALRFPAGSHPGIVVLRVPDDWGAAARTARLVAGIEELGNELAGAIVIVEPSRTRIFRTPTM